VFGLKKRLQFIAASLLVALLAGCGSGISTSDIANAQESDYLVIKNGLVVTMDKERRVLERGWVAVKDGEILAVGEGADWGGLDLPNARVVDADGKAVLPGLVNTHTHVAMVLFRGFADDLELTEWLQNFIFPAEAKFVDTDFVRAGANLALAEMIRGGTTTFADMYFFEDEVAEASKQAGVRAVLAPALMDFPTPQNSSWDDGVRAFRQFAERWESDPLITPCIGPHAVYTVSPENLKEAGDIARELDLPLHIHVSETSSEVANSKEKYGKSPVSHLDQLGVLDTQLIAAHCVHLDDEDRSLLIEKRAGVAHCPESNMKLASGAAPIPLLISGGALVGLGTDGAASNNDLDMWGEMDSAAKMHKLVTGDPTSMPAELVVRMATVGGAEVLHMADEIGSIEIGKRADIILVDLEALHMTPRYNIYSHLVYAAKPSDVTEVFVEGRQLMRDRVLLTLDEAAIRAEAEDYRTRIEAARDESPDAPTL
jgi:5-methylthioadenosine/S-adenosylhomocysteine deaminase